MLAYNEGNTFALENTASAPCRDIAGAFIDIALSGRRVQKSGAGLAWKVDFWLPGIPTHGIIPKGSHDALHLSQRRQ